MSRSLSLLSLAVLSAAVGCGSPCPDGYERDGDICYATPVCPAGTTPNDGGQCLPEVVEETDTDVGPDTDLPVDTDPPADTYLPLPDVSTFASFHAAFAETLCARLVTCGEAPDVASCEDSLAKAARSHVGGCAVDTVDAYTCLADAASRACGASEAVASCFALQQTCYANTPAASPDGFMVEEYHAVEAAFAVVGGVARGFSVDGSSTRPQLSVTLGDEAYWATGTGQWCSVVLLSLSDLQPAPWAGTSYGVVFGLELRPGTTAVVDTCEGVLSGADRAALFADYATRWWAAGISSDVDPETQAGIADLGWPVSTLGASAWSVVRRPESSGFWLPQGVAFGAGIDASGAVALVPGTGDVAYRSSEQNLDAGALTDGFYTLITYYLEDP